MDKLIVVKIGGNLIDDSTALQSFLKSFAAVPEKKLLIHGGGKLATDLAGKLNLPQQMIDGRRITDSQTLNLVTMVYAGLINKTIVASLQSFGTNALGLTGADGNCIRAHKRTGSVDFGFAGDVDEVNAEFLKQLLRSVCTPVLAPITHDKKGQLLNTNADTIAQEVAAALSADFEVDLVYCFEKEGVLLHADDEASVIPTLQPQQYEELRESGAIFAGMIPKLDNAFNAISRGVSSVIIGNGTKLEQLLDTTSGTRVINE
ncbi:MAG TPA: acetylglutamate kinase [Flavisolibacter sp.]|nr:acetylglutamate kinase [Flavisolibacter sp.]